MSRYIDGLFAFDHEMGAREQRRDQEAITREAPTFTDAVGAAYRQEQMMHSVYERAQAPENTPDAAYVVDDAEWKRLTTGLPVEYHASFYGILNRQHADWVRSQIDIELADKETLSRAGGLGTALTIGSAILDPVQLLLGSAFGPAGAANKVGRVSRLISGGVAAAVPNAAAEAALVGMQQTRDPANIAAAAAFGFALGGGLSALSRGDNVKMMDRAMAAHDLIEIDAARKAGLPISDEGVAALRRYAGVEAPTTAPVVTTATVDALAPKRAPADAMAPVRASSAQQGFVARLDGAPEAAPVSTKEAGELTDLLAPGRVVEPKTASESSIKAALTKATAEAEATRAARSAEITDLMKKAAKESAWKRADEARAAEEALAYAQREVQIAEAGGAPVPSSDSGFLAGSVGSAQVAMIKPEVGILNKLRFDIFGKLQQSSSKAVRVLNRLVHDDAVGGAAGDGAQGITATGWASMAYRTALAQARTAMDDAYEAFAKSKSLSMGDKFWQRGQEEFYDRASRAVWGAAENDPHVLAAAKAWRELAANQLAEMKRVGVDGVEEIAADAGYLARLPNHERFSRMMSLYGTDNMVDLVLGAMRARGSELSPEKMARIAKHYVQVRHALPYSEDLGRMYHGERDFAALRDLLKAKEFGIDEADMDDLIGALVDMTKDTQAGQGKPARLKPKTALDESFAAKIINKETGQLDTVRIADIWETDLRQISQRYTKQTSGLIGYAKVGIKSTADWNRWKKQIADEFMAGGGDAKEMRDALKMFDLTRKHSLGMPLETEPMGNIARYTKVVRDLNFVRLMGQVGFAQLSDVGNYAAAAGTRAFFAHMPALADMRRAFLNGKPADSALHRQLMSFIGVGGDAANAHAIMRSIDENEFYKPLTKTEQAVGRARDFTARFSGLESINLVIKQHGEIAMLQRMVDFAVKRADLDPKLMHRLATDGLSEEMLERVFKGLKQYSGRNADDIVESFDWTKWQRADPEAVDAFRMALYRQVNRAIQEPTIGETAWWMHSTLGKVLTQFRSFMLTSFAKQTLHGLNHFDKTTMAMWSLSTMTAAMAYTVQNAINYGHNPEELNKRLAMGEIMKAGFQRSTWSSIAPMLIDSAAEVGIMDKPVFAYGRSTGLASGAIGGVPTVDAFNRLGSGLKAMGRAAFQDDPFTQAEAKSALGLVTPNLLGIRSLVDAMSHEFPAN